ncbi:hypothetical protein GGR52DRAFT_359234 [Hypoxylon sp. FL1284]|nr:hypothetical protein GGR52DRAFT_359234 [Hypoxylon sp. FL1284]
MVIGRKPSVPYESIRIHPDEHRLGASSACQYLPFRSDMVGVVKLTREADENADDPFATDDSDDRSEPADPEIRAVMFERGLLCLDPLPFPSQMTTASLAPVFLGHGIAN